MKIARLHKAAYLNTKGLKQLKILARAFLAEAVEASSQV
jgi:hypothetical protein